MSNTNEQLTYAKIFAEELGWFYEAKEGAWDAFKQDHSRWRPRLNKRPRDFEMLVNGRGKKIHRLDNEDLAQRWCAFIGFANEAVNEKKALFEDKFYSLVFQQQTQKHGFDYDFSLTQAREAAIKGSPSPSLMLIAYLTREFAIDMSPTASQNRDEACQRLGINPNLPKAELTSKLSQDNQFILNQILGGTSLLFTEFVGFILFRAFGENIHRYGQKILENHSFYTLVEQSSEIVIEKINQGIVEPKDILVVLWFAFVEKIEDMLNTPWGESYRAANIKIRFVFARETRGRLYRDVQNTNDFMKKRSLKTNWAIGVLEGQGLFEFIRSCVL